MSLVDTHCHIDVEDFEHDREAVLQRAERVGVTKIVVPGFEATRFGRLLEICRVNRLYPALGLHPIYLERHQPSHIQELERLVAEHCPVAIGEVGLDYFVADPDERGQQRLFEIQVRIAEAAGLPLLLHIRKAHDPVLAILRRVRFSRGGVAHAFNGSLQQAEQFVGLGFKLGFGGVMTYDRARKIRGLARTLPLSALVLETDAPDLPPARHHGERNSPENLPLILHTLAELRGDDPDVVAAATTRNAETVIPGLCRPRNLA